MLHALLIKEAKGRILQSQEQVIVLIKAIGIAGEGTAKEFQLVIGTLRWGNAHLKEPCFQIGGHLCQMLRLTGHEDIEVRPDHRLLLRSNHFQHLINVGFGEFVAGVWHRGMALALTNQPLALLALGRYLYHLVIDHTIGQWYSSKERQQIGTHAVTIDRYGLDWFNQCRQVYHINIHQREAFDCSLSHPQTLIAAFQVGHSEWPFLEIKGHKTVQVFVYLVSV